MTPSSILAHLGHLGFASSGSGPMGDDEISKNVEMRKFHPHKDRFPPEGLTVWTFPPLLVLVT